MIKEIYNRPFDHNYFIGYVNQIYPDFIRIHFPSSVLLNKFIYSGEEFNGGLVGNYVTIEGENHGFIGKILDISLPEKERMELNEKAFRNKEFHPTGKIELLLSFDYFNPDKVDKGINSYPNIGSKVFVCSSQFIQRYFKSFGVKPDKIGVSPTVNLGVLHTDKNTKIEVSQQALFGRHCAIVGTTGGGKSWTLSSCIEETINNETKVIVIDATGEYASFEQHSNFYASSVIGQNGYLHYSNLTVEDLFILLRPGGQVQAPKLLEAIKSLKIVRILNKYADNNFIRLNNDGNYEIKVNEQNTYENIIIENGCIKKMNQFQRPFNKVYYKFIDEIESLSADFDLNQLPTQLQYECIADIDFNNVLKWGGRHDTHLNNCISLILRAKSLVQNPEFDKILGLKREKNHPDELTSVIQGFLSSKKHLLRISFENVSYDFQNREILSNAIGKYLLSFARNNKFKDSPLILFIDEAHQYLNKKVRDEYFESTSLNAFDQIAKECRKYGLFLCLATQMPRDIPVGTLSQMGTFIVHRLINHYDKEAIENACSTANRNSLSFLPSLSEGEAILMGVDFPMPVIVKIKTPDTKPDSQTPQFKVNAHEVNKFPLVEGRILTTNIESDTIKSK